MNDPFFVGAAEGGGDLGGEPDSVLRRQGSALDPAAQGLTIQRATNTPPSGVSPTSSAG
jgi:hypothetical protein